MSDKNHVATTDVEVDENYALQNNPGFLNKDNPQSIYYFFGESLRYHMDAIMPSIWDKVCDPKFFPAATTDVMLKMRIWEKYEDWVTGKGGARGTFKLVEGICSRASFYGVLREPLRLAWVLIPPKNYNVALSVSQELWLSRVNEILSLPLFEEDADGKEKVNTKNAGLILAAGRLMDMRKHGAYTQRIEQKSLNVNVDANKPVTMIDIDEQLNELEQKAERKLIHINPLPTTSRVELDAIAILSHVKNEAKVGSDE